MSEATVIQYNTGQDFAITPTGSALGAYVTGLDLAQPLASDDYQTLKRAWQQHHVLIFKKQQLSDKQLLDFATWLGDVFQPADGAPVLASQENGKAPEVVRISNVQGGYTGNGELAAHIDHQWTERPSKASFLYGRQVPEQGGDTSWYNLQLAWENLDDEFKKKLVDLRLITWNPFVNPPSDISYRYPDHPTEGPSVAYPLIRTHGETGQRLIYLSDKALVEVLGIDPAEGHQLITRLRQHVFDDRHRYEHHWEEGDVVLWDNRSTAHYRTAFDPDDIRDMRRVSLAGERSL